MNSPFLISAARHLSKQGKGKLAKAFKRGWLELKGRNSTNDTLIEIYDSMCYLLGAPCALIEIRKNRKREKYYNLTIAGMSDAEVRNIINTFSNEKLKLNNLNGIVIKASFFDYSKAELIAQHIRVLYQLRPNPTKGSIQEAKNGIIQKYAIHGSPLGEIVAAGSIQWVYDGFGAGNNVQRKLVKALK